MSKIPSALNQLHAGVSVTEVEIDYDLASGTYDLQTPEKTMVFDVIPVVETAFAGGNPTMTRGDDTDADGFTANADVTYTSARFVARSSQLATSAFQKGRYFVDAGKVRITWTKHASSTAGKLRVFVLARSIL